MFILPCVVSAQDSVKSVLEGMMDDYKNNKHIHIIYGETDNYNDFLACAIISSELAGFINESYTTFPKIISAEELPNYQNKNLIIVGGPCANKISASLLNEPGYSCKDWKFSTGYSFVKAVTNGNKSALIVVGSSDRDTLRVARALKNFETSLKLGESDEVSYSRSISIKEALEQIILEYNKSDDLVIVTSDKGKSSDLFTALEVSKIIFGETNKNQDYFPRIEEAGDMDNPSKYNLILIGGPCANSLSEEITDEIGYNCKDWDFREQESIIKVVENEEKIALIIAGTTSKGTQELIDMLRDYKDDTRLENNDEIFIDINPNVKTGITRIIEQIDSKNISIVIGEKSKDIEGAAKLKEIILNLAGLNESNAIEIINDAKKIDINNNVISLGGPCANKVTEALTNEKGFNCKDWGLNSKQSLIKVVADENRISLIIAGTEKEDTQRLITLLSELEKKLLFNYSSELIIENNELVQKEKKTLEKEECKGFLCMLQNIFFKGEGESQLFTKNKDIDYISYLENKDPNKNCYECFMEHQSKNYISEILNVLGSRKTDDAFEEAERRYILGKVTENKDIACSSIEFYKKYLEENDLSEDDELVVYENLLFVVSECLSRRYRYFYLSKVIELSNSLGYTWKADIYSKLINNEDVKIDVEKIKIKRDLEVPRNPSKIILGKSFIEVKKDDLIGVQVERTVRDWFSINIDQFPNEQPNFNSSLGLYDINYMEGNILRRIKKCTDAKVKPFPNTLIISKKDLLGNKWYATDEKGIFRFEVLPDKTQYPTTKCIKNICLLVDTHGISSLVAKAVKEKANLVIGCGDYYDKMEAAYYLTQKGINVLYPPDRFASEMIGFQGKGMALGSAPVKAKEDTAIIGDQPIEIGIKEKIVVQTTTKAYPAQYYDAPYRYFNNLEELSGINLDLKVVDTPNLRETSKVINKARELDANVVAVRVAYNEDYVAVRKWLEESSNHRAVLFHSSPYEAGYKIFEEFPEQTSFGDPHPIFE